MEPASAGLAAPFPGPTAKEQTEPLESFGDLVPYADPAWYQSVRATTPAAAVDDLSRAVGTKHRIVSLSLL